MVLVLIDEVRNFTQAWASVVVSLCYCFFVGRWIEKGVKRLILIIPVIFFFFLVPLHLSTVHLAGTIGFFISWLANFKLALFAFGKGPLSSTDLSLLTFLLISCFPIKVQQSTSRSKSTRKGPLFYGVKGLLLLLLIKSLDYIPLLPEKAVLFLFGLIMYLYLELMLAITASLVRAMSNLELEPQFNDPYLATSLQDFWGKRWNLMVSEILRPTVYQPVLNWSVFPRRWASAPAALAAFLVSGIMHELIFYYNGRLWPSGRLMSFFLVHGSCIMAEIAVKKAIKRRWSLPTAVSRTLTILFVFTTGVLLFFPEFKRCKIDEKAFEEYAAVGAFLQDTRIRQRFFPSQAIRNGGLEHAQLRTGGFFFF